MRGERDDLRIKGPTSLRRAYIIHVPARVTGLEHVRTVPRARAHILLRIHLERLYTHRRRNTKRHIEVCPDPQHRQHHRYRC